MKAGTKRRLSSRPVNTTGSKARKVQSSQSLVRSTRTPPDGPSTVAPGNARRDPQQPQSLVRSTRTPSDSPSTASPTNERRDPQHAVPAQAEEHPNTISQQAFELTGLLEGDLHAVTTIITAAENRIIRHVNGLQKKLLLEMKQNNTAISDLSKTVSTMDSTISQVKTLTTQNSAAIGRNNTPSRVINKQKRKNGKQSFEGEVEALHPTINIELQAVFNSLVMSRAAGFSISTYTDYFHQKQDDIRMTARVLSIVSYGLSRDKTMNEFKDGIGKHHAAFRFRIAKTAIKDPLLITEATFRAQEEEIIADLIHAGASGNDLCGAQQPSPGKPSWLAPDVLTLRILRMAQKQHDCVKSEWDPLPTSSRKRRALHVCRHVFKCVIDLLRRSRDRSKLKMFGAGLFLLADWTKVSSFQDGHCNPGFNFICETNGPISPKDIRDTVRTSEPQYQFENARLLKELIASRDEMVLQATYNVSVVVQRRVRARNEETQVEFREMKRHFNILRIALAFIQGYTQCPEDVVLSSHPSMLRHIYRFALLLRELFIDHLDESLRPPRAKHSTAVRSRGYQGEDPERSNTPPTGSPSGAGEGASLQQGDGGRGDGCNGVSSGQQTTGPVLRTVTLRDILPSESETDKEMVKVLKMSLETYDKLRIKDNGDDECEQADEDGGYGFPDSLESEDEEDSTGMLDD